MCLVSISRALQSSAGIGSDLDQLDAPQSVALTCEPQVASALVALRKSAEVLHVSHPKKDLAVML